MNFLFRTTPQTFRFKRGDVVQLKSGGPTMTIRTIGSNATGLVFCSCDWFSSQLVGECSSETFLEDQLVLIPDRKRES